MSTIETISGTEAAGRHPVLTENRGLLHTVSALFSWFGNAMMKRRTRLHLSELSNDLLNDVGIAPAEARREIKRFFWD